MCSCVSMSLVFFSAGLAVSDKRAHLLLSVCHTRPAEGSVWITWRSLVLFKSCRRLFSMDFPDIGQGVLLSICVQWLCCGEWENSSGPGLYRWHSLDPGRAGWTNAGLAHSTRGAVFIPSVVWTVSSGRVPQWLCLLFKTFCQRGNIESLNVFFSTDIYNKNSCCYGRVERVLWEKDFN